MTDKQECAFCGTRKDSKIKMVSGASGDLICFNCIKNFVSQNERDLARPDDMQRTD